jgi:hypothetical protein
LRGFVLFVGFKISESILCYAVLIGKGKRNLMIWAKLSPENGKNLNAANEFEKKS